MVQDAGGAAWDGSLETFRLLANSLQAMIAYYDSPELGYGCRFANKAYAGAFGLTEASIIGKTFIEIIGEAAAREVQPSIDTVVNESRAVAYVRELAAADGSRRWIEVNVLPNLTRPGARPVGAFVVVTDITGHRLATQALRESEERLAKFMQASAEGIAFHRDGIVTDANPPLCEMLGYTLAELRGRHAIDFVAPDQRAHVQGVLDGGQDVSYESAVIRKDGKRIPVELIGRTLVYGDEKLRMTVVRDLRDRHAAQARIHHLAHHDALTGLPNRMSFMERLARQIDQARSTGKSLALLFVDLDHFKRVNDSLGHLIGDQLLQTVAARISASLRAGDVVARFGGDEFIVLLGDASRDDVGQVAHKLLRAIELPVEAEGRDLSVTPSVGIAMFPHDGATPTELIKNADTAMYIAKSHGRANCQFFDPAVASAAYDALVLESELAQALPRDEFVLHYQPQVRAGDGRLAGIEALIRWMHPERGMLRPDAFIALAEQQRIMLPISQWVLRSAARAALRWRATGLIDVPVAVNLSSMQFRADGFVDAVAQVLREEGVPGDWLELELTERMLMDDVGDVKRTLLKLRALGMRVSVDDFGTGYSSLAHLKELPIDGMKIDRSFVRDLPHQRGSVAIARAVVQMAQGLSLTVVAEGVENEEQRRFLVEQGCDLLQGELISPPLPASELTQWIVRHRAASEA
jgi:diguanylate cyclase (GGDEF)-like protein/PAS domain S-box-containing protein